MNEPYSSNYIGSRWPLPSRCVINLFLFSAQTEVVRSGGGGVNNQGRGQSVGDGNGRRKSQRRPAAEVAEDEAAHEELKTRQEVGNDVILHCSANREVHLCRWKTPYLNTYIVGEGIYVERGRIQVHTCRFIWAQNSHGFFVGVIGMHF